MELIDLTKVLGVFLAGGGLMFGIMRFLFKLPTVRELGKLDEELKAVEQRLNKQIVQNNSQVLFSEQQLRGDIADKFNTLQTMIKRENDHLYQNLDGLLKTHVSYIAKDLERLKDDMSDIKSSVR